MAIVPLRSINSARENINICVRVQSMWDSLHVHSSELLSLDMILVDSDEQTVHCYVWRHLARHFCPQLIEGMVYELRGLKSQLTRRFHPVPGEFKLLFLSTSIMSAPLQEIVNIPDHCFHFADWELITQRVDRYDIFTDIIGIIIGFGKIEYSGHGAVARKRRELKMQIEGDNSVNVVLWGNIADRVDDEFFENAVPPLLAVMTTTFIKSFGGQLSLSSTSGTKIYFNPQILDAHRLLNTSRHGQLPPLVKIESKTGAHLPIQQQMFFNRKKIIEIKDILLNGSELEVVATCHATIKDFVDGLPWCYIGCDACPYAMKYYDGLYSCDCRNSAQFPLAKYI